MKKVLKLTDHAYFHLKFDLKMRLTTLFLIVSLFQLQANESYAQKTKVTLTLENVSIESVLNEIESLTDFKFIYKSSEIDYQKIVSIKAKKEHISIILKNIFDGSNTVFKIVDKQIILKKEYVIDPPLPDLNLELKPNKNQGYDVKGVITDVNGQPLPGASIIEKGTTNGTQTDFDGNYSLTVNDENAILVVSYLGFSATEIPVNGKETLNIVLQEDTAILNEIIVTGYTAQSKRLVTGAVETIKNDELSKNPATNVEQQLQGKISGVNIVTSGDPSGTAEVRIRGIANLGTQRDPLYIIDGAPSSGLDGINPDDIETISVLKDASAASIYGARAANGVVLVTTKRGAFNQKTTISYNGYSGIDVDPGGIDLLNAQQWGELEFQGQLASVRGTAGEATFVPTHPSYGTGLTPVIPEFLNGDSSLPYDPDTNRLIRAGDTDWYDVLTRVALVQNHSLSMRGGGETSRYSLSFGFLDREATVIENDFQRYTTRLNAEFSALNNRLRFGENVTIAYSENNGNNNLATTRQRYHPLIPRFDEGGNFAGTLGGILGLGTNTTNPEANQVRSANHIDRTWRIFGNAFAEADILPNLTFKTNLGLDYTQLNNTAFNATNIENGDQTNNLNENSSFSTSLTWTNTLNYRKKFKDHAFDLLLGTEAIELKSRFISFSGQDFFLEDLNFVAINTAGATNSILGASSSRNLSSLFGKLDYNFKNKYLFNATVRRDGSSALGVNNRFDVFPAFGAGWVISDENFLKESSKINLLKLRAGWGVVGNQNSLGDFDFVSLFSQDATFRSTGVDITGSNSGDPANGIVLLSRGNENLVWETSETLNIGLDYALFNNKVSGSIEWYDRRTKDLILPSQVPLTSGSATAPFVNAGEIQNTGLDFSLNYKNSPTEDFNYSITGIISTYKNKVLSLDGNPDAFFDGPDGNPSIAAARTIIGGEIAAFYGFIVDGVLQQDTDRNNDGVISLNEQAGNFNFRDLNGDGEITLQDDRGVIGSPHPDFTYSLNLSANYKNWDFSAFLRGSQGSEIYGYDRIFTDFQFRSGINRSTRALDAWTPNNPTNTLAEFNLLTADYNQQGSSYYVEDGSFLRLQTLQIGYTFPKVLGLSNFRLYLQGQNVFTIAGYDGIDPEIRENTGLEINVDRGNTSIVPRTYLLGLNLSF